MADDDETRTGPLPEDAVPEPAEAPEETADGIEDADEDTASGSEAAEEPETPDAGEEAESAEEADPAAQPHGEAAPRRGAGIVRAVTVISFRVVRGLAGLAAAALVIGTVGLVPLSATGIEPLEATVVPEPADLVASCTGALLRLGDDTGANAGQASAVGVPTIAVAARGGTARTTELAESDAGTGGGAQAPAVLELAPADGAALAGAQAQALTGAGGLRGLAATSCHEAVSSAWLVGGATTVGRTTLLLLVNPTGVAAEVTLRMWGESGPVVAPGMSGITVAPGSQRVIALSGFAPGLASLVVHVEARGGQVVAALQTSVIRVLDPGGVDIVSAGAAPARETVVPGVRLLNEVGVSSSLGLDDHADLAAVARVGNPGSEDATVEVSLTPTVAGGTGASFRIAVPAGAAVDVPLSSGAQLGEEPLADGSYTVAFRSDEPIVAAVRAATIPVPTVDADGSPEPGPADLAWFATGPALRGDVLLAVAEAPDPVLVVVNPENAERTIELEPVDGGEPIVVPLPAAGSVAIALEPGAGYLLRDAKGLRAAVSFAAPGQLAGYPLTAPRQADTPLVVRP